MALEDESYVTKKLPKRETKKVTKLTITQNDIVSFPHKIIVILGNPQVGKTTLTKALASHYANQLNYRIVEAQTLEDIQSVTKAVIILDDIKSRIPDSLLDILRSQRHRELIIIITHHLLNYVPTPCLQLAERVILFNNKLNTNSRIKVILPSSKLIKVCDYLKSLEDYHFVVVKNAKVYGKFYSDYGRNLKPIIEPVEELKLEKKVKAEYKRKYRLITKQILAYLQETQPDFIDYQLICEKFGISYGYARKIISVWRKRGFNIVYNRIPKLDTSYSHVSAVERGSNPRSATVGEDNKKRGES